MTRKAKMNPRVRSKWIRALRSGKYQQGSSALREGDRFCCLGVLCDIAEKEGVVKSQSLTLGTNKVAYGTGDTVTDRSVNYLPREVMEWAGLEHFNPPVKHPNDAGVTVSLAGLNDSGWDFDTISRIIQKEL